MRVGVKTDEGRVVDVTTAHFAAAFDAIKETVATCCGSIRAVLSEESENTGRDNRGNNRGNQEYFSLRKISRCQAMPQALQ